ncbi:rust resistance kinase Lr10-like [Musa acuminata AAA Group]|uniref:rust resistance kinase Lr10-like n=1 Tax=Musa acuminata AAA Group TaxID=214697 RepID=UPI0031D41523
MKSSTPVSFSITTVSPLLLLLLLLTTAELCSSQRNKSCPRSSCGDLSIRSPFRLRGDPPDCGEPQLELVCEGKDAVLYRDSDKYYVTDISYKRGRCRLLYAGFVTGTCRLPPRVPFSAMDFDNFLSPFIYESFRGSTTIWASFMNCTKEIHSPEYVAVPCLSGNNSTTYVVVESDAYALLYLKNSCSFITYLPVEGFLSTGMDIFELLRKGFLVEWSFTITNENIVEQCWTSTTSLYTYVVIHGTDAIYIKFLESIYFEMDFLTCIFYEESDPNRSHTILSIALVLIILLDVALCLLVGRLIFATSSAAVFLAYNAWKMRAPVDSVEKFLRNQQTLSPTRYAYSDIIAMTSHFREKIGQGGFGSVFKGHLLGRYPVAVKMLGGSKFDGEEFINEVSTIGRIHHLNVVRLLGFCSDGSKRALVYEYMPGGSLDKHIFSASSSNHRRFTMEKLRDIALGVARGIDYLHHGCDMQIVHFDIKPHNILLDHAFTPKISDFGLAKLYPKDYSLISISAARGTIGYIAPELISRSFGVISHKSDVYSFGMLLMEMAGGRRNVNPKADKSSQIYYPSWIYDQLAGEEWPREPRLDWTTEIDAMERKLCMVGLWCIQMKSCDRPSMSRVVEMLEGDVNDLRMPPKPFFSAPQPSLGRQSSCMPSCSSGLEIISEHDDLP